MQGGDAWLRDAARDAHARHMSWWQHQQTLCLRRCSNACCSQATRCWAARLRRARTCSPPPGGTARPRRPRGEPRTSWRLRSASAPCRLRSPGALPGPAGKVLMDLRACVAPVCLVCSRRVQRVLGGFGDACTAARAPGPAFVAMLEAPVITRALDAAADCPS